MRFPDFNDDWKETTLGEVAEILSSQRVFASEYKDHGIPFYRGKEISELRRGHTPSDLLYISKDLYNEYQFNYGVPQLGDILITAVGTLGNLWIVDDSLFYFKDGNIIWLKSPQLYPYFLYSSLEYHKKNLLALAIGSSQKALTIEGVRKLNIAYPTSSEQKKIADFLSLIDERIQSCSETLKERKLEKAGLLNQLFSQKLRFPDFTDEWTQTTLGEIAEILNSQRKPITSSDRISGDYPYYGASGIIDYVNAYIFDEELLLVGEDGAKWGKYEKTAFLVNGKYWVNNHAHVLRLPDISAYKFVESYLFFLNLKPFVTGDAPPKLTLESLKSIPIFMPSLAEQKKIADFLSLVDERIEVEEQLLKKYEEQKKYLLRHMFV